MTAISWPDVDVIGGLVIGSSGGLWGVVRTWSRDTRERLQTAIAESHAEITTELRAIQTQVRDQAVTLATQGERLARVEGRLGIDDR